MTFSPRRHLPRFRIGPALFASSLMMGCAFYNINYDKYLDDDEAACLANTEEYVRPGDGDGDMWNGDGDTWNGDGVGGACDCEIGGSGGQNVDPPAGGTGGVVGGGAGGDVSGGTGGVPAGGTGGAPSGGAPSGGAPSGGAPSGGAPSGGAPSGGAPSGGGTGGTASVLTMLRRDLSINEIKWGGSAFVELYNARATDIDASQLYVYGDVAETGNICQLSGVVPAGGYLVVQQFAGACLAEPCVAACTLNLSGGETVGLFYAETPESLLEQVDVQYFETSFSGGDSYQATFDGSNSFQKRLNTVGATNNL